MIGLSLVNARRILISDIVRRWSGNYRSAQSRPADMEKCRGWSWSKPVYIVVGKRPVVKDRSVKRQMTMAISGEFN